MFDATPENGRPAVPMLAVEPVLMFRASCYCGWWKVTGSDEQEAKVALIQHRAVGRCDCCGSDHDHDELTVIPQRSAAAPYDGAYCADCAPIYAAV